MFGRRNRNPKPQEKAEVPDIPMDWKRLIRYLGPYKARMGIAIIALISSALLSLVFPAVISAVVDSVLKQSNVQLLDQITAGLLLVFFLRSVTSLVENYNLNYIGESLVVDLRLELYNHLQKLSMGFFASRRVGELMSRLSNDVTVMRTVLTNNVNVLIEQTLSMVGAIIVMLVLNWRLTGFILLLTPIIIALGAVFGIFLRRTS